MDHKALLITFTGILIFGLVVLLFLPSLRQRSGVSGRNLREWLLDVVLRLRASTSFLSISLMGRSKSAAKYEPWHTDDSLFISRAIPPVVTIGGLPSVYRVRFLTDPRDIPWEEMAYRFESEPIAFDKLRGPLLGHHVGNAPPVSGRAYWWNHHMQRFEESDGPPASWPTGRS